jgi:SAM-dependent methyltransferase
LVGQNFTSKRNERKLEEAMFSKPYGKHFNAIIKAYKETPNYGEVLEVGCGSEPTTNGIRVDLIDQKGMRNFRLGNAYGLPFPDKSFDWIVCHHVLEHLNDPFNALVEFRRVTRVGLQLRVPWKFFAHGCPDHKCSFDSSWFRKMFPNDFITTYLELSFCHYSPIFLELVVRVEWRQGLL